MNISCRITNANTQCVRITNPPERVDTYQYSHHYDRIAHDRMIIGAHFKTSYDPNKGHSISDFSGYISQLPEGHYEVINGKIVKR